MKAVVLDHFSAEEVAEGRADSHCSGQGTLRQVEAAASAGPICNHQNSDYAEIAFAMPSNNWMAIRANIFWVSV